MLNRGIYRISERGGVRVTVTKMRRIRTHTHVTNGHLCERRFYNSFIAFIVILICILHVEPLVLRFLILNYVPLPPISFQKRVLTLANLAFVAQVFLQKSIAICSFFLSKCVPKIKDGSTVSSS